MPDYSKGKIYKLHILGNDELIYYGSTIQTLSLRISGHRKDYRKYKNGKIGKISSFILFDTDLKNVVITLIENYPCNSKYELEARERFYIENNNCVNKYTPGRTKQEWEQYNKEYNKKYRNNNKDKIKEYRKEYYENNKEELLKKKKEWRNENKEYIKEYFKKYDQTEKRKEYVKKRNEQKKEKIECSYCKSIIRKDSLKRHQKSQKCLTFQNIEI